jgi:gas vesicle protein
LRSRERGANIIVTDDRHKNQKESEINMDKYTHEQGSTSAKQPANFLTGVLLGGVAGAVTALLFAPQSGQETRQQIQQKAAELRDQTTSTVENTFTQVQSKASQLKADLGEKATNLKHDLGEKATNLKQQGQDVLVEQLSAATKKIQGK